MTGNTLCKAERLSSKLLIEKLFAGEAKSFSAFPLRVVYIPMDNTDNAAASILVSVSKKRFKRAVKRNRIKRQIREAYRQNKQELLHILTAKNIHLAIAFIYLDTKQASSPIIEDKIRLILARLVDKML